MAGVYPFKNYRVFFTPLIGDNVYGSTIDVTQDVDLTDWIKNVGRIKKEIDNGDYDIGIFTFADITLTAINFSRKFNSPDDALSIFKFKRDRCKVEIKFFDEDANETTSFKGLINDDATRQDLNLGTVRLKVLSLDSIFRQVEIPAGAIVSGDLFSTAIKKILNVPEITSTLTYSASNINVDLDLAIDDGEVFSNEEVKSSLDQLLLASNSILFVDNTDTVFVKARTESAPVFMLFGHGDKFGRENIIRVKNFNTGVQRAFSSVKIGDTEISTSEAWVAQYGFRQKSVSLDFITTKATESLVADNILTAFKVPKLEIEVDVKTIDIIGIDLLDTVSIDYGYRTVPDPRDDILPMLGSAQIDEFHLPITEGSFRILPNVKWKVIGIDENTKKFETTLKLRQTGSLQHDGFFGVDAPVEWGDGTSMEWSSGDPVTWSNS